MSFGRRRHHHWQCTTPADRVHQPYWKSQTPVRHKTSRAFRHNKSEVCQLPAVVEAPKSSSIEKKKVAKNGISTLKDTVEEQSRTILELQGRVDDLAKDLEIVHGSKGRLQQQMQSLLTRAIVAEHQLASYKNNERQIRLSLMKEFAMPVPNHNLIHKLTNDGAILALCL